MDHRGNYKFSSMTTTKTLMGLCCTLFLLSSCETNPFEREEWVKNDTDSARTILVLGRGQEAGDRHTFTIAPGDSLMTFHEKGEGVFIQHNANCAAANTFNSDSDVNDIRKAENWSSRKEGIKEIYIFRFQKLHR